MLRIALGFFLLAIAAGVLGFGGIAAGASSIAELFFWGFVVLFVLSAVVGVLKGRSPKSLI